MTFTRINNNFVIRSKTYSNCPTKYPAVLPPLRTYLPAMLKCVCQCHKFEILEVNTVLSNLIKDGYVVHNKTTG